MHHEVFNFVFIINLVLTELEKPLLCVDLLLKRTLAEGGQLNIFFFENGNFFS